MFLFLLRRSVGLILVLWAVITLTFVLIHLAPGGPFDRERKIPPAIEKKLHEKYHLDESLFAQYTRYLKSIVFHGDLGISFRYRDRSVNEIIAQTLPVSGLLGSLAFCIATFGGVGLGTAAAVRPRSWTDFSAMLLALLAISIPAFITGPLAVLIIGLKLKWLPVGGWDTWCSVILPSILLAAPFVAYIARLMRSSLLETLDQDFIRTARAKGLSEMRVVYSHALKVAILPVVSFLGPLAANLLTGSLVIESVFNIPGMGGFFVNSVLNKDWSLLSGVVIVYCVLLVVMNFLVDVTYHLLDPRVQTL